MDPCHTFWQGLSIEPQMLSLSSAAKRFCSWLVPRIIVAGVRCSRPASSPSGVEVRNGDLRVRGAAAGAALFARGEGIWMGERN